MTEIDVSYDKLSSDTDKSCFGHNLSEIERHFKRLKVDESVNQSVIKSKNDYSFNYFSPKTSPYSLKMSFVEKRQSINGFRRQRLHLSNKLRVNSDNSLKNKSIEEECVTKDKELEFCTDFSELKVNSIPEKERIGKQLFFKKDFKVESNEWRKSIKEYHKMCKNSDESIDTKVKANKIKKLNFKDDKSCARQAMDASSEASADELAAYLDDTLYLPRKMSFMAEMMYT